MKTKTYNNFFVIAAVFFVIAAIVLITNPFPSPTLSEVNIREIHLNGQSTIITEEERSIAVANAQKIITDLEITELPTLFNPEGGKIGIKFLGIDLEILWEQDGDKCLFSGTLNGESLGQGSKDGPCNADKLYEWFAALNTVITRILLQTWSDITQSQAEFHSRDLINAIFELLKPFKQWI